jgi:hypothetical protein
LTTNAGASATSTQLFFSDLPTEKAVASVASSVCSARTTSSRGRTATGLKKCSPTTRSGCSSFDAISVTDSAEVLVASTHSGETIASTSANTCCLTDSSSKTASMTRSASAKTSLDSEPVTRPLSWLSLSWFSRPRRASLSSSPCT